MTGPADNETWLIEEGDRAIQKKTGRGPEHLTTWERLVYALWVADYGMRNAGDLDTAGDVWADFQSAALGAAEELSLPLTRDTFALAPRSLEAVYLERFELVCHEVRGAGPTTAAGGI